MPRCLGAYLWFLLLWKANLPHTLTLWHFWSLPDMEEAQHVGCGWGSGEAAKGRMSKKAALKKKSTSSSQNVLWLIRNSRWNNKAFSLFPSYGLFCDTVPQLPVWWCPMVCLPRDRPGSTTWSEVVASGVTCPCTVLHPALFISFPSHSCIHGMVSTKITH